MSRLSISDIKSSKVAHLNTHILDKAPRIQKPSKQKDWIATNLAYWCKENSFDLTEEHKFHPKRKWRFDWAITEIKVAIEYDGLFSKKSRHTTAKGFTGDAEKLNAAAALGWRVIRLTALNYRNLVKELDAYRSDDPRR